MERFLEFIIMVLCWVITGFISYMGYNQELDKNPAIVICSVLLAISLFSTLHFFIPNTVRRYLFGGDDRKWW
jgi:hypothetical protein